MAGNRIGSLKTVKTVKKRYGVDEDGKSIHYVEAGRKGGKVTGVKKGFAADIKCDCDVIDYAHYKRECAGAIGGSRTKRGLK